MDNISEQNYKMIVMILPRFLNTSLMNSILY